MKKLILTIAALAGVSYGAFAQGTVSFQNFIPNPWPGGLVWTNSTSVTNGGALSPSGYHVELLFGPVGSLTLSNSGVIFTSANNGGQFFDGAVITLAGITAGSGSADTTMNVALAIRGWTGAFADYNSAKASGTSLVGETLIFSNPTGGGGSPAATPANLVGWLANNPLVLSPVPEPSTIALGGLGVAALLLFRRRK